MTNVATTQNLRKLYDIKPAKEAFINFLFLRELNFSSD